MAAAVALLDRSQLAGRGGRSPVEERQRQVTSTTLTLCWGKWRTAATRVLLFWAFFPQSVSKDAINLLCTYMINANGFNLHFFVLSIYDLKQYGYITLLRISNALQCSLMH